MGEITIDGLNEDNFRRSIENMLRHGRADQAAGKLRALLEPYARADRVLPSRFLDVSSADIGIGGWTRLGERIGEYDRPDHEISAIGITLVEPEKRRADSENSDGLPPRIETSYFSDEAYPFSEAARCDLLEGYSLSGCEWEGDCEETDSTLSVRGVDDLYGALVRLETELMTSDEPDEEHIRAGSLGSCFLLTLIHQAVRDAILNDGLPRPLCVMAGSSGVYPFFDAPVISSEEYLDNRTIAPVLDEAPMEMAAEQVLEMEGAGGASDYDSLLNIGIRKGKKKPVIMLEPDEDAANTDWLATARLSGRSETVVPIDFPHHAVEREEEEVEETPAFVRAEEDAEPDIFEDAASFSEFIEPEIDEPVEQPDLGHEPEPEAMAEIDLPDIASLPAFDVADWPDRFEPEKETVVYTEPVVSLPPPPPPQPEPVLHRHSLRSRIAETQRPERSSSWPMAALRWLLAAIRRI